MVKALVSVTGLQPLLATLEGESLKGTKKLTGFVGYSSDVAPYAIYVHEDLTKHHPVGQAKFLETAARRSIAEVRRIFVDKLKGRSSLRDAIYAALDWLRHRAVQITPIDTGLLRSAAYINISEY